MPPELSRQTQEMGWQALYDLLDTSTYQNLTLDDAIARYAPPSQNNTAAYQTYVSNQLGVPGSTPLSSLSEPAMTRLGEWIANYEGFNNAGSSSVTYSPPPPH